MTAPDPDLKPIVTPADTDGVARVIGGVGGIRFQWDELDKGARIVSDAAAELHRIWVSIKWIDLRLSAVRSLSDILAAGTSAAAGVAAAEGIHAGLQRLSEGSSALDGTADRIRRSRLTYELAEISTRDHISHAVAGVLPSVPYRSTPVELTHTRTDSIQLQGTVDGLLSRVSKARDEPGSSFEVLEVAGQSGPTYVVVIPGTEWTEPGQPFNADGIAEAKFEDSRHVNEAVASALEGVGAEAGANVVLVGYSQGGMHAVNLANSGRVHETYSVDLVVTAGSPITEEDVPQSTTFLHLAHEDDRVPKWNFAPITDRPNQVSVILDHPVELAPGEGYDLGPAHKIYSYREGAQAVDLSSHPSIAPITAALSTAVAGPAAKRHVFQITRAPFTGPQPTPAGTPFSDQQAKAGLASGAGDRSRDK